MRWIEFASGASLVLLLAAMSPEPAKQSTKLLTWPDLTSRARPMPDATISYGDDAYQKVDIWLPPGKAPHPVVLMVHGGCWQTSIADRTLMNWIADDLRKHGIAVWNIDYRGVDRPGGGYPGTFLDAAAAADAMRANAAKYHLDLKRLVAVGHSAGGHLALWLAARPRLPRGSPLRVVDPLPIGAVISLGGLPDLEAVAASPDNGCGTEVVSQLTGPATEQHQDVFADTSVLRLLPLGVPQHLINGETDRIIPMRFGVSYVARAHLLGDRATLDRLDNTGHVELVAPDSAAWARAKERIRVALQ